LVGTIIITVDAKMDKLEFENFEFSDGVAPHEDRSPADQQAEKRMSEEEAIELSNSIIKALAEKAKAHNKLYPRKKVTLAQLKKVYHRGAEVPEDDKSLWAMARVNMFLRMKSDDLATAKKGKVIKVDNFIDISASWEPLEEDFDLASRDLEIYKLSNFNNINELYLEEYKKIENWQTWV
jgi:hypothetical protein